MYTMSGWTQAEEILYGLWGVMLNYYETNNYKPLCLSSLEYGITDYGRTFSTVMTALHAWGAKNRKGVFNIEEEAMNSCVWKECIKVYLDE